MKNFLRGLAAGIAIGYLTAPRSGKETREQLSDTVNGMKEQWDEAKVQITELIEDVKAPVGVTSADDLANKAERKFDQYKHEVNQKKEDVYKRQVLFSFGLTLPYRHFQGSPAVLPALKVE